MWKAKRKKEGEKFAGGKQNKRKKVKNLMCEAKRKKVSENISVGKQKKDRK